jgi:hypothetical protein
MTNNSKTNGKDFCYYLFTAKIVKAPREKSLPLKA